MLYKSTRGRLQNLTFEDVLLSGILQDGGLAMPENIPTLSKNVIRNWSVLSYPELVEEIMHIFISEEEISKPKLKEVISQAYKRFDIPEIIQTHFLEKSFYVAELFHGPTLSFKDLALSVLGQLLEYFLEKRQKHLNVVVATSGDTGSAAIEAIRGLKWIDIVVLYPKGKCSILQELQMTTVTDDNVTCIAVEKCCDELDIPIRECFECEEFCKVHNVCCINSVNWARIMIQIAHYFYLYLSIDPHVEKEIKFVVPTGGAGNITAGFIAKLMGLPIKLVSAVNRNDMLYHTVKEGKILKKTVFQTYAVAMDIQVPYNIERILYLVSSGDSNSVAAWMKEFHNIGAVVLPDKIVKELQCEWQVDSIDDNIILKRMKFCWEKYHYLICPHSSTAIAHGFSQNLDDSSLSDITTIYLATASPTKFPEACNAAEVPCDLSLQNKLMKQRTKYVQPKLHENLTVLLRSIIEMNSNRCKMTGK